MLIYSERRETAVVKRCLLLLVIPTLSCLLQACQSLPPASELDRPASYALDDPASYPLGEFLNDQPRARDGQSAFHLLSDGMDALLTRLALIESAEKTVDLQYYIFRDDDTGLLLASELLHKADKGVRVRLLVDDVGVGRDNKLEALDAHPNIEIRRFNPLFQYFGLLGKTMDFALHSDRLNHRMHNKAFVADNAAAIIGGRNIADQYFNADSDRGFADLEVLATGALVRTLSGAFDDFWNSDYSYPLKSLRHNPPAKEDLEKLRAFLATHRDAMYKSEYMQAMRRTPLAQRLRNHSTNLVWAKAEIILDSPGKVEHSVELNDAAIDRLTTLINEAQNSVSITTPYLVPSKTIEDLLLHTVRRGVETRILTNSFHANDLDLAHAFYTELRPALLRNGIRLYEMKPDGDPPSMNLLSTHATLHAKAALIDDKTLVIGSVNIDPRSFSLNTETVMVIHSPRLVEEVEERIESASTLENSYHLDIENGEIIWITNIDGETVRYNREPLTNAFQRLYLRVLRCLPIKHNL